MRVKDLRKIKDIDDIRDLSKGDVVELLDELRVIASKRGTELLGTGKKSARRAIGAPDEGAVTMALLGGIVLGVIVGGLLALVFSPFSGEARRRVATEVDRVRERLPEAVRRGGNGRGAYPRDTSDTPRAPRTGTPEGTPTA